MLGLNLVLCKLRKSTKNFNQSLKTLSQKIAKPKHQSNTKTQKFTWKTILFEERSCSTNSKIQINIHYYKTNYRSSFPLNTITHYDCCTQKLFPWENFKFIFPCAYFLCGFRFSRFFRILYQLISLNPNHFLMI